MSDLKTGLGGTGEKRVNTGTNWQKVLTPVLGLILFALGATASYLLSGPATVFLRQRIPSLPPQEAVRFAVAFGIFLILLLVMYMVFAALAVKPKTTTTEAQMDKEKKEKQAEALRSKRRQAEMKQRMKQNLRNKKD